MKRRPPRTWHVAAAERSVLCPICPRFVRFNMSVELIQLRRTVSARSFYVRVETDKAGQIGQSADRSAAAVKTSRLVGTWEFFWGTTPISG